MDFKKLNIWLPILFALVTALGMKAGYTLYKNRAAFQSSHSAGFKGFSSGSGRLEELMALIDINYVDTVDVSKIADEALADALSKLDPHSSYISRADLEAVNSELEGSFDGIGIEFSIVNDTINVVTAISGGPSEELGIQAGDKIILINDTNVANIKIKNKDVMKKLRGRKGTQVKVSVKRSGAKKLIDFNITRAPIPIYSVDTYYMLDNKTGYIKVNKFAATTYEEFMQGMTELKSKGMTELVLDLRDNPGGYLQAATLLADEFISGDKLLVYTQGRKFPKREYRAKRKGIFEDGKVVVLLDSGSASAAEILSGAIQDWDRGSIVGRRSFGKGLVQEQFDLSDGSACRITIAKYYTPTGRCIQKPYTKGHAEEYYEDLEERFKKGELTNADSIKYADTIQYKTPAGKILHGGGGITPDVFVPIDTNRYTVDYYLARIEIPSYVYQNYGSQLSTIKTQYTVDRFVSEYQVSDQVYNLFLKHASNKNKELKINKLDKHTQDIKNQIKATIARQIWKDEGFYKVINKNDDDVNKALKVLRN